MATNWNCASSVQLVISDLNEIAADAYRHRIRPALKKGGNGVYDRSNGGFEYHLPKNLTANRRAQFEIIGLDANAVELRAVSLDDPSCWITATVNGRGSLGNITFPGRHRQPEEDKPAVSQTGTSSYQPAGSARPILFFEER